MQNTFCKFLNNGLVYNNNSDHFTVSPCCYFSKNYIIDTEGDAAKQLVQHKQKWLKEDFAKTCKLCIDAEKGGQYSYRQASFDQINNDHDQFAFLTIAVNKKCNLACASCDSHSSSFWYQENARHNITQSNSITQLHVEDKQGAVTEKFLSTLSTQDLSNVTYVKFGGGEPIMSNTHEQILTLLPHPEKTVIQYTSNFSLMPSNRVLDLWEKFKLVKWIASLDGVSEQFEFLRWPYQWKNLEKFIEQAKTSVPGNVMFGTEHTINPLNVYYFDQFQSWFKQNLGQNKHGDESDFNIHVCSGVMGLEHTPPLLREAVEKRYGADHSVVVALQQNPYSGTHKPMIRYLDQLDTWRSSDWRSIFPEVQEFFDA